MPVDIDPPCHFLGRGVHVETCRGAYALPSAGDSPLVEQDCDGFERGRFVSSGPPRECEWLRDLVLDGALVITDELGGLDEPPRDGCCFAFPVDDQDCGGDPGGLDA